MANFTFTLAASADDALTYQGSAAGEYPPTGTIVREPTHVQVHATRELLSGSYTIRCGFFRWNTSALPDTARVVSAYLRTYIETADSYDGFLLAADYYNWVGTTADHTNSGASGDAIVGYYPNFSPNQYNNIPLDSVSGINLTGTTSLRMRITGGQPSGGNFTVWSAYDSPDGSFTRPQLIVTYADPVTLLPDNIVSQTNAQGVLSAVTNDPASPDGNWLTAT